MVRRKSLQRCNNYNHVCCVASASCSHLRNSSKATPLLSQQPGLPHAAGSAVITCITCMRRKFSPHSAPPQASSPDIQTINNSNMLTIVDYDSYREQHYANDIIDHKVQQKQTQTFIQQQPAEQKRYLVLPRTCITKKSSLHQKVSARGKYPRAAGQTINDVALRSGFRTSQDVKS